MKRKLALAEVYGWLEPGPVVLLSTHWRAEDDVMAMSWHTMLDFNPPLLACVVSNRNHSFSLLKRSRECAINIPGMRLLKKVVSCGNSSGRSVDKFAKFGLTALRASRVAAPLIRECFVNLECRVVDTRMVERYNLFVLEVVAAWIDRGAGVPKTLHHRGKGRFMIAGRTVRTRSRMK